MNDKNLECFVFFHAKFEKGKNTIKRSQKTIVISLKSFDHSQWLMCSLVNKI